MLVCTHSTSSAVAPMHSPVSHSPARNIASSQIGPRCALRTQAAPLHPRMRQQTIKSSATPLTCRARGSPCTRQMVYFASLTRPNKNQHHPYSLVGLEVAHGLGKALREDVRGGRHPLLPQRQHHQLARLAGHAVAEAQRHLPRVVLRRGSAGRVQRHWGAGERLRVPARETAGAEESALKESQAAITQCCQSAGTHLWVEGAELGEPDLLCRCRRLHHLLCRARRAPGTPPLPLAGTL